MRLRSWTKKPWLVVVFCALILADLAAGIGSASIAAAASAPSIVKTDAGASASSAVTVAWDNANRVTTSPNYTLFKNMQFTVSQTKDLTDQGIIVNWTGGTVTPPQDDKTDYMQIMQCWGDPTTGPTPQQCEWGEPSATLAGLVGSDAASRSLVANEDPAQPYTSAYQIPEAHNIVAYSVPFDSIDGSSAWDPATYYSPSSSNEVTVARSGQDGSGSYDFSLQSSLTAPQLGCGAPVKSGTAIVGRSCWLVVVPRGEYDADGKAASANSDGRVTGSPLTATNWADRVQVKLDFNAIGASCPLGRAERRTAGTELVADAMTSWQSALCATGTTYGYSEIGDSETRTEVTSGVAGSAGLGFVTDPVDPTTATGETLDYAPVSESAIVVTYNIDKDLQKTAPDYSENGTPVTNLVLSPRLVAKLLTQSYQDDVPNGPFESYVNKNPLSIRNDPDFLALNPEFKFFTPSDAPDGLMVALGDTDAAAQVWAWLRADPDARNFLNGQPDPWGETVNPAYLALNLGTDATVDSYPKTDLTTTAALSNGAPGYGTLNLRPYTLDMDEAAHRTLISDIGSTTVWDQSKQPAAYADGGAQVPGSRFELAITDSNASDLYALNVAKLKNQAGDYVAPDTSSINAAVSGMVSSGTAGVSVTDPTKSISGAYPLAMLSYAVINVCDSPLAALKDYKKLLTYIVGAGNTQGSDPGDLPLGYVPLSSDQIAEVTTTNTALQAEIDNPVCPQHLVTPSPTDDSSDGGGFPVSSGSSSGGGPHPSTSPTPLATQKPLLTPAVQTTATRYSILAALLFAIPCLGAGPVLLRLKRK